MCEKLKEHQSVVEKTSVQIDDYESSRPSPSEATFVVERDDRLLISGTKNKWYE